MAAMSQGKNQAPVDTTAEGANPDSDTDVKVMSRRADVAFEGHPAKKTTTTNITFEFLAKRELCDNPISNEQQE